MIKIIFKDGQGLGNQLWLFAVAKSVSEKLEQELVIEDLEKFKGKDFLILDYIAPPNKINERNQSINCDDFKIFSERIYYDKKIEYFVSSFDEDILRISGDTILDGIFQSEKYFFNDLDKLISYRILLSEILIYGDLLIITDELDIDILSNQLSEISATSKLNYEKLPEISEFTSHTLLVGETLKSAEDLHGRLIASLRNNETDVSNALLIAINMNKEIEQNSFNDALEIFKINKTNLYNSLATLP